MKPSELYEMEPIRETEDIYNLSGMVEVNMMDIEVEENEKIVLKYYADPYIDGRRVWQLFSVWFDGKPVMVCQKAGREGRDHTDAFVTDPKAYNEMNEYLFSLRDEYLWDDNIYSPDSDIENLISFYGSTLEESQKERQTIRPGD